MMIGQSLSTLARNNLNAVIFVISNGVYAIEQVYVNLKSFEPGPAHVFDAFDVLPKWDYMALAKAYGAAGFHARTIDELNVVLDAVKNLKNQPALVEIVIPEKDLAGQMKRLGEE
jgi:indolepyruvate decarboxylase